MNRQGTSKEAQFRKGAQQVHKPSEGLGQRGHNFRVRVISDYSLRKQCIMAGNKAKRALSYIFRIVESGSPEALFGAGQTEFKLCGIVLIGRM